MPFRQKDLTESLTELLCCVVYSISQSSLSGETAQYNGYLFFSDFNLKIYMKQKDPLFCMKFKSIKQ